MSDLQTPANSPAPKPTLVGVFAMTMAIFVLSACGFELARRLEWSPIGFYVVMMIFAVVINLMCILIWNPGLIERRMFSGPGTKPWDFALLLGLFAPSLIAMFVVAVREAGDGSTLR